MSNPGGPGSSGAGPRRSRTFGGMLAAARAQGRVVGAFTCYDILTLEAVVDAAAARNAPAIALLGTGSFDAPHGPDLANALAVVASNAPQPVIVQLDHAQDSALIRSAIGQGISAVLADGSRLPLEENQRFTRETSITLAAHGIGVEGELGRIEGSEDIAEAVRSGGLTDPRQAEAFAAEAKVECLAVSVGNVHGKYQGTPTLDYRLLNEIASVVDVPLALHGASGLDDDLLLRARECGVAKMNFNTDLRTAYFSSLRNAIPERSKGLDLLGLQGDIRNAITEVVTRKLTVLGWGDSQAGPSAL